MEKRKKRVDEESTVGSKRKSGAQPKNRNAVKLGLFTAGAMAEVHRVRELIKECKDFLNRLRIEEI